jgi:hypothetical protein
MIHKQAVISPGSESFGGLDVCEVSFYSNPSQKTVTTFEMQ